MRFNPIAIGLWVFCAALGYAVADAKGAAYGLALASGASILAHIFD
jgi:hypothetical protein